MIMNDLQNKYTAFYDLIEKTVLGIKDNSIKKENIDEYLYYFSICDSCIVLADAVCGPTFSLNMRIKESEDISNDSITLHNRIYGDFIDEKYKSAFIELAKKKNSNGILKLAKDAVKAIINAEL